MQNSSNQILDVYMSFLNEADLKYLSEGSMPSVDKLKNSLVKNIKASERFLKDHGVDVSYVKNQAKKASSIAKSNWRKNIPAKQTAHDIVYSIGKSTLKIVIQGLPGINNEKHKEYEEAPPTTIAFLQSIGIIVVLFFLSSTILYILSPIIGSKITFAIAAIVVAPFLEEYGKKFALEGKFGFMYTGLFASVEAGMYIAQLVYMGASLPVAILSRAFAAVAHLASTWIQSKYVGEDDKVNLTGYFVAVGLHSLWNFMAIINTPGMSDIF